jgi:hypothetical protein
MQSAHLCHEQKCIGTFDQTTGNGSHRAPVLATRTLIYIIRLGLPDHNRAADRRASGRPLSLKADITRYSRHVSKVPTTVLSKCNKTRDGTTLLDHLVGLNQHLRRNSQTEAARRLEIYGELEFFGLRDR